MYPKYKKIIITPCLQIFNVLVFVGMMFLDNTHYWGYYSYRSFSENFFESVFSDVLPMIAGILVFLNTLILLALSITSLCLKKPNFVNIIASVMPFLLLIDYGAYLIFIEEFTSWYYLDDCAFLLFIPLGLMFFVSIAGLIFSIVYMSKNKQITMMMNGGNMNQPYAPSAPMYGMNGQVPGADFGAPVQQPAFADKKYCMHCGNECVAQAVICPNCGCSF